MATSGCASASRLTLDLALEQTSKVRLALWSHTMVATWFGVLYAAAHDEPAGPAGQSTGKQVGYFELLGVDGVRTMPSVANGLPLMLEMS